MANSNNICTRFINYVAVLIVCLFSNSVNSGTFGGGGAGGEWGPPDQTCEAQYIYTTPQVEMNGAPLFKAATYNNPPSYSLCPGQSLRRTPYGGYYKLSAFNPTYNGHGSCVYYESQYPGLTNLYYDLPFTRISNPNYDPSCENKCPVGYEKDANGKCQPKKCPAGQTLVNGQCKQKQCPAGQALDKNGQCFAADDSCPAGQKKVNGRCITLPPDDPDPEPNSEWPPFCEWASVMCQWHEEWQQWSNDYAANEEKANLDREELKRIGLDSKENLDEINQKMTEQNQKLDEHKIKLDQIKDQDQQFYDELRLWLQNFDSSNGNPSEQNPSIEFPPFCDWSVQVCNWYLDWKDWREDYNAHNEAVIQKFNAHLEKLNEIKQQDKDYYEQDLEQNNDFYDDVRDFFDWYKGQSTENPTDPNDPNNPENQDGNVAVNQEQIPFDESQRITFVNACPPDQQFTINFMGSSQTLGFSYQPLCQFMTMIRPFVIAIAYLIGAYILMGLSRGSSE